MRLIFESGLLVFSISLIAIGMLGAQVQSQIFPAPSANTTGSNKQGHLFFGGGPTTYNVNVYCNSGQQMHQSKTVKQGQTPPTINVNCGNVSGGGGGNATGQPAPPATICIVTPTNKCAGVLPTPEPAPSNATGP